MKAMLLAAGFGTRLAPLTDNLPKPLIPVIDKPLIAYNLNLLRNAGIEEVMINVHHLGDKIIEALGTGKKYGLKISYSEEKKILGTGGGIRNSQDFFKGAHFLVINSDILVDIELTKVIDHHNKSESIATMVLRKDIDASLFGEISIDRLNQVQSFLGESRLQGNKLRKRMFTGIHVLSPKVFDYLNKTKSKDEFSCIINDFYLPAFWGNERISGCDYFGRWSDLGTIKRYYDGCLTILEKDYDGMSIIGDRFVRGDNVGIDSSIIGNGCELGDNVRIKKSILWDDISISSNQTIDSQIVYKTGKSIQLS